MEYKIKVTQHIHSNFSGLSSKDVFLEFEGILLVEPRMGISYKSSLFPSFTPIEIVWDNDKAIYDIYVESDKSLYNYHRNIMGMEVPDHLPEMTLSEIVEEYLQDGWKLRNKKDAERLGL